MSFDIWDVHGRAIPYTLRPPRNEPGVQRVRPSEATRLKSQSDPAVRRAVAAYEEVRGRDQLRAKPLAEHWMTRPVVTLPVGTSLDQAWPLFRARQFRHVPIVEVGVKGRGRPPVGMLSDRELLAYFGDHGQTPKDAMPELLVDDVMTTDVLCARPGTSIHRIAHVMARERLGAVPIVDPDQGLTGILTRGDILRLAVELTGTDLPSL